MGSIGGDRGDGNVEGQGGEEESNAPQIVTGPRSWKDRFLDSFFGQLHPFLICFPCAVFFFFRFQVYFCKILASSINFDLIQPLQKSREWVFSVGLWAQGNNMLKNSMGRQLPLQRLSLYHMLYKTRRKNNSHAVILALNMKDINIFMSCCCNHSSMNGYLIYQHSKASLLQWDMHF